MTIMTLTLLDVGDDELEVRVMMDGEPAGTLAEHWMEKLVAYLQCDGTPAVETIH